MNWLGGVAGPFSANTTTGANQNTPSINKATRLL
ncbi:hypothetical protein [Sporisorium scitamineum]|uniref:Uncharacterized protein n=1 Tax=Sporisorium scitamineum TaxID=49012 RepID=A0A0F7S6B2_9BASI|nr:hypothetical protein [Sporisorium scitamineum]